MSKLNQKCEELVSGVGDALGCAIVDVESGLLLAYYHDIPYFTQSYLEAVSAASVDMFRGRTVSTVEDLLSKQRGNDSSKSIQEIQMTTERTYHFMTLIPGHTNFMIVLITGKKANLGMGWTKLRQALPDIAELCP